MKTPTLCTETQVVPAFNKLICELSEKFKPLQIFCFYKSNSVERKQSCFVSQHVNCIHDYCLLLVTSSATRIDYEIQDYANSHFTGGSITVICHSNQSIRDAIDGNSRFFKAVFTDGELLYSHDGLLLKPLVLPFDPINSSTKALRYYNHRIPLVGGFMSCAFECLQNERYGMCAFMLHQATEQACILLIRVNIAYRSEFHNLQRLLNLCRCFSDQPYELFLSNARDERLFDIMSKSYSHARYKEDFSVSKEDARSLYNLTSLFIELSKTMCLKKIAQLESEAFSRPYVDFSDPAKSSLAQD